MAYPDSVRFLYSLGNELKTAKLGLERINTLLASLGKPHKELRRVIHVAGTNGKGSTCAMIESGMRASGLRTGLFTSPHLLEPTERIRIDGEPVSSEDFTFAFDQVHAAADALLERGEIDAHPSYFETVTAMAFLLFYDKQTECNVVEVGLGGRLDATNVVEPETCVITPIDFDHEKFLGASLESIAAEKAGILKEGVPLILAPQRPQADRVVREWAGRLEVPVLEAWRPDYVEATARGGRIHAQGLDIECALAGRHQVVNAMAAATALSASRIDSEAVKRGISQVRWPGRIDLVCRNPDVILDGAHNPSGARALAEYVTEFYSDPKPVLIFGAMRDKAIEEITGFLFPHFAEVVLTAPAQPRALAPEAYASLIEHPCLRMEPTFESAFRTVAGSRSPIFVSGSLFLVAEALEFLQSLKA